MSSDIFLLFCLLLIININLFPFSPSSVPPFFSSRNILSVHCWVQCNDFIQKYKSLNVSIYYLQKRLVGKTMLNNTV